jgi:hypothetical protein
VREREILAGHWSSFGARFSDQHHGWLTRAVRREATGVEHVLWTDAALERLAIGGDGDHGAVTVTAITPDARTGAGAHLAACTDAPRRVVVLETNDGRHAGLRIEDAGGGVTELRFRVSARPNTVNGVLEDER